MAATEKGQLLLRGPLHRRLLAAMEEDDTLSLTRPLTVEEFLALAPEQSFARMLCMTVRREEMLTPNGQGAVGFVVENGTWAHVENALNRKEGEAR